MLKGLCAVAAALTMSCVASAHAGEAPPDHQYFPGTDPWTTPDFHLPKKREWPDGPNKEFLKNLQRPDIYKNPWRDKHSQLCCDAGDTVKTKFKVEPGDGLHPEDRWYALGLPHSAARKIFGRISFATFIFRRNLVLRVCTSTI